MRAVLFCRPKTVPDRWDQIAAAVPGRTKKQCILRVKELVSMAKQAALKAPVDWTEKEESVLQKAASKLFPPGTTGRTTHGRQGPCTRGVCTMIYLTKLSCGGPSNAPPKFGIFRRPIC